MSLAKADLAALSSSDEGGDSTNEGEHGCRLRDCFDAAGGDNHIVEAKSTHAISAPQGLSSCNRRQNGRCGCIGLSFCKGVCPMSFVDSLLVALFMMAIVFIALFALFLFVKLFSLIVETAEHAAKHKKAAQ